MRVQQNLCWVHAQREKWIQRMGSFKTFAALRANGRSGREVGPIADLNWSANQNLSSVSDVSLSRRNRDLGDEVGPLQCGSSDKTFAVSAKSHASSIHRSRTSETLCGSSNYSYNLRVRAPSLFCVSRIRLERARSKFLVAHEPRIHFCREKSIRSIPS